MREQNDGWTHVYIYMFFSHDISARTFTQHVDGRLSMTAVLSRKAQELNGENICIHLYKSINAQMCG